ncbi:MAG: hypothetical protein LC687_00560 [Actinobacteria bacterium]|nr:hypothetical protein [Actinomycetota bacterium]MCA1806358.1 hypothetical protein [Actinomycetota bacterium]
MNYHKTQAEIALAHDKRMFNARYKKKCWNCGDDITDVYDIAPREEQDDRLRICPQCHNNLEFKKGSPLELANMIRYAAGLDPISIE